MKLSQLKQNTKTRILLYGDSGAGKTVAACTFPKPLFLADFDGKVSSAANFYKSRDPEVLEGIDYEDYTQDGKADLPFRRFLKKIGEFQSIAKSDFPFKTIVVDSLTTLSEETMKYVISMNPGMKCPFPGIPAMGHYRLNQNEFMTLMSILFSLPCHVVFTGHIGTDKDESTGRILRRPLMQGKLADKLPIYFEEVYRQHVDSKGNYVWQTKTGPQYMSRTQIDGLGDEIPASWKSIKEKL